MCGCCSYGDHDYDDPNYEGEESDPKLAEGPFENRGCTDILCCLIFIGFLGGMGYIGVVEASGSDPTQLMDMYDGDGYACGRKSINNVTLVEHDATLYPYLYFWFPYTGQFQKRSCVKECVSFLGFTTTEERQAAINSYNDLPMATHTKQLECYLSGEDNYPPKSVTKCYGNLGNIGYGPSLLSADQASIMDNLYIVYPTELYFNKLCFPVLNDPLDGDASIANQVADQINAIMDIGFVTTIVADITTTKELILGSGLLAMAVGFLFMYVMKLCAGCITWTIILLMLLLSTGLTYFMMDLSTKKELELQNAYDSQVASDPVNAKKGINYSLYIFYACAGFTGALYCTVICFYNRIRIAIQIMKTSADFVTEVCMVMLVPPVIMILILIWAFTWLGLFSYVYAMGEIKAAETTIAPITKLPYGQVILTQDQKIMCAYFIFGFLWINAFFQAMNQFILASATCIWYFSPRDPENQSNKLVNKAVSRSVYRGLCKHFGSIAFGSFLLACVQFAQLVMKYIEEQAKKGGEKNKALMYLIKACQCCLLCFERIIKFINKNAYIQIAIKGSHFCAACRDAFFLILRNTFLFAIAAGIGNMFIAFGKVFICVGTVVVMFFGALQNNKDISSPYGPLLIMAAIAWVTGSMFMSVWGMATDSILQCFCIDKELNKGSGKANLYCPQQLLDLVQDPKFDKLKEKAEAKKKSSQEHYNQEKAKDPNHGKKNACCCC